MKNILTIYLIIAWTGLFAQRTTLPNTATQTPSNKNLKNLNGQLIEGLLVVNDSVWLNGGQVVIPNGSVGIGTAVPLGALMVIGSTYISMDSTQMFVVGEDLLNTSRYNFAVKSDGINAFYQVGRYKYQFGSWGTLVELSIYDTLTQNDLIGVVLDSVRGAFIADSSNIIFQVDLSDNVHIGKGVSDSVIIDATSIENRGTIFNNGGGTFILNGTASEGRLHLVEDLDNGTNTIRISAPASLAASWNLTLPPDDGNANQVLTTDGAGGTSWTSSGGVWTAIDDTTIAWLTAQDTLVIGTSPNTAPGRIGMVNLNKNSSMFFGNGVLELSSGIVSVTDRFAIANSSSPLSGASCNPGEITWDANYIYVCTGSGAWKRAALTGGY